LGIDTCELSGGSSIVVVKVKDKDYTAMPNQDQYVSPYLWDKDTEWHKLKLVIHQGYFSVYLDGAVVAENEKYTDGDDTVNVSYISFPGWQHSTPGNEYDNIAIYTNSFPPSATENNYCGTEIEVQSDSSDWINTGLSISSGEIIKVGTTGLISVCCGTSPLDIGPDGASSPGSSNFPGPGLNNYSLIGRIGETGTPFFIGSKFTRRLYEGGTLYLIVNDDPRHDNTGSFLATISTFELDSNAVICDINGDGKTGLEEAINALQIVAGINREVSNDGFTYAELSGNTFQATETDYPTCTFEVKFNNDNTLIGPEGDTYSYILDNGTIIMSDNDGGTNTIRVVSRQDSVITAQFTYTGETYIEETGWGDVDFSSLNNNATALKDWFIANGFWPGSTITSDGRVTNQNATFDGQWWIENNVFYFTYPEVDGCVDYKAYKLVNNQLMFATDANHSATITLTPSDN